MRWSLLRRGISSGRHRCIPYYNTHFHDVRSCKMNSREISETQKFPKKWIHTSPPCNGDPRNLLHYYLLDVFIRYSLATEIIFNKLSLLLEWTCLLGTLLSHSQSRYISLWFILHRHSTKESNVCPKNICGTNSWKTEFVFNFWISPERNVGLVSKKGEGCLSPWWAHCRICVGMRLQWRIKCGRRWR